MILTGFRAAGDKSGIGQLGRMENSSKGTAGRRVTSQARHGRRNAIWARPGTSKTEKRQADESAQQDGEATDDTIGLHSNVPNILLIIELSSVMKGRLRGNFRFKAASRSCSSASETPQENHVPLTTRRARAGPKRLPIGPRRNGNGVGYTSSHYRDSGRSLQSGNILINIADHARSLQAAKARAALQQEAIWARGGGH